MWTYEKMKGTSNVQGEASGCGKYYRHHKDCFLELGLVKAAFLWELLKLRYDVLICDLTPAPHPHPKPSPSPSPSPQALLPPGAHLRPRRGLAHRAVGAVDDLPRTCQAAAARG